ncbi:MAG: chromate efflux transporter [Thermoleophilaceae bacterium]|nr:chromate efflux transporter [Thermoleophilaceae bacterium]
MESPASGADLRVPADRARERSLGGLVRYFLKLGGSGFGGPIALVGYMQRDLVEERRWFTEAEFQQALAVGQTMPGPLAAQAAMWFGYLQAGARGALAVTLPFVIPPFLIVTAVAILYTEYQGLDWVHHIFRGVGPAVLAIIAIASYKLARSTNKTDPVLWVIAAILCAVTAIAGAEIVWVFLVAGAFGAIYYGGGLPKLRGAASISPVAVLAAVQGFAWTGTGASLGSMGLFFIKAGAFTFGSGLAIVPFLHEGLVDEHGWLTEQQFVDAVAMGLISPGPVVIMATFAGYLVYGLTGAIVATVAVFLPVYLFVVVPGRFIRRHEQHPRLQGFVKGATAAAAGAIAGAAIVIGDQVIEDNWSILIAVVALGALLQKKIKVPEPALVSAAAAVGLVVFG